jgi:hypothetical protein
MEAIYNCGIIRIAISKIEIGRNVAYIGLIATDEAIEDTSLKNTHL